jgi:hypothetical protein
MSKSDTTPRDWKANAKKRRIRSLIGITWCQILEIYDDTPAAVHMVNIMRSKGEIVGTKSDGSPRYRDPYYNSDEVTLKIMENYREELDRDALLTANPEEWT